MYKDYKQFFYTDELIDLVPYAESVLNDDVEAFAQSYEPYADQTLLIDPIEIAIAHNSIKIIDYLLDSYDYANYSNPFGLVLPVILMVLDRDSLLVDILDTITFDDDHYLLMYEHMMVSKDKDYFLQFFKIYGIDESLEEDLLITSLSHQTIFDYLRTKKPFKKHLKSEAVVYEIINFFPSMLSTIASVTDLNTMFSPDAFIPVLRLEDETLFQETIDFIAARGVTFNDLGAYGLSFFHEALRHAVKPSYIHYLVDKGADITQKTSRGYAPSHQLLFRDAAFTLELSKLIVFDAQDYFGMTLKDYDHLQRKANLSLLDILLVVKLAFNMDESAIYELSQDEFFDLADKHGIRLFINAFNVIVFENTYLKEQFEYQETPNVPAQDTGALQDTLEDAFIYDYDHTLELMLDYFDKDNQDIETILATFAKDNNTGLKVTTDTFEINKVGHVEVTVLNDGSTERHATVQSNYLDVYYIHRYYGVPLENITYAPKATKKHRFIT
jgi:hypothetical protein